MGRFLDSSIFAVFHLDFGLAVGRISFVSDVNGQFGFERRWRWVRFDLCLLGRKRDQMASIEVFRIHGESRDTG